MINFPYLVDIGLGNYCPYQCNFCYTNSSTNGQFANFNYLKQLSKTLLNSGVLEIVLGGGEPTLYKNKSHNIVEVCNLFYNKDIRVGITTKNYQLYSLPFVNDLVSTINSLAFSCNTIKELLLTNQCLKEIPINKDRVYIQTILGLQTEGDLREFLQTCIDLKLNKVTLLGYKTCGRGRCIDKKAIPNLITIIEKLPLLIGMDSVAIEQYRDDLFKVKVPKELLTKQDGKYSCYIDALKKIIKKTSFTDSYVKLDLPTTNTFLTSFNTI